jgi:hypothetical protein
VQTIDDQHEPRHAELHGAQPAGRAAVGDVLEVHSGQFSQPLLSYVDQDPADVWWDILTVRLAVPPERIGFGSAGAASRSGLPPKVTDRAPGDATTQAKLKVTLQLPAAENADELIDQLSFIMGGATVDVAGQIVFRQIFPLTDATDKVTVSPGRIGPHVRSARLRGAPDAERRGEAHLGLRLQLRDRHDASRRQLRPRRRPSTMPTGTRSRTSPRRTSKGLGVSEIDQKIWRWCYNSADAGLFLATQLPKQVVRACSTGLRQWSFRAIDSHPELMIGDVVTIVTDGYTDYDPTRKVQLRGWGAYQLVLTSIHGAGRQFTGFMLGLGRRCPGEGRPGARHSPTARDGRADREGNADPALPRE